MEQVSVIGCGRWGTFLGWYMANYCHADTVLMYDMPNSPTYLQLLNERKNDYLTLSDNMLLTSDIQEVLKNDFIIISISCQNLRKLAKQLNTYNLDGKTFLLAMKGLEEPSAEILADVFAQEVKQNVHILEKHVHALTECLILFYHDFCPFLIYHYQKPTNQFHQLFGLRYFAYQNLYKIL